LTNKPNGADAEMMRTKKNKIAAAPRPNLQTSGEVNHDIDWRDFPSLRKPCATDMAYSINAKIVISSYPVRKFIITMRQRYVKNHSFGIPEKL
jgi:hypothetical protein